MAGVETNEPDGDIIASEFELQSRAFQTQSLEDTNLLIPQDVG